MIVFTIEAQEAAMSTPDTRATSPSPLTGTGVLADEAALKRAFDDEYAHCLTSAKSQLGEAPAPKLDA